MNLWQMSFSGAIFILAVILIRRLTMNQLPKRTFLILWEVVLFRLLMPFSIPSMLSVYSVIQNTPINTLDSTYVDNRIPTIQGTSLELVEELPMMNGNQEASSSIWFVIWLMGVILCSIFFAASYWNSYSEFQTSLPVENDFVNQWLKQHPLRRTISIRQSDRISTPLTYGIMNPVILMPKKTDWKNTNLLKYILFHEYMHICQWDNVIKLIVIFALCIHWFNPMVWVMFFLFNRDMELACDERVIRYLGEASKSPYAMALINMEVKKSDFMILYNHFSKNAIEERITAIMKIKKKSKFAIFIAIGLILSMSTIFATSAANITGKETSNRMDYTDLDDDNHIQKIDGSASNVEKASLQYETVGIKQLSLQPGTHKEYGRYSLKKGDVISVDLSWKETGNVYFAIGKEFGTFRGLKSSGDSTSLNTNITVKEDGEYYIFLGIQGTDTKGVEELTGEIAFTVSED